MQADNRMVLEQLQQLEPLFHAACADATPAQFEALVAPEFWEIGASGRPYSREFALSVLASRQQMPASEAWIADDYAVSELAPGLYLLSYRLQESNRSTLRTTLWRFAAERWQAVFHQGTVVGPSPWTSGRTEAASAA